MTLHNTSKIKQRPVTDGMTDEELARYKKEVHEARRGNTDNIWDTPVGFGASYCVEPKPLSDDLKYGGFKKEERKREHEEMEVLAEHKDKHELIKKWKEYVEKQKNRIKQIEADKTLPVLTKQKKIQACLDKISEYQQSIKNTEDFLAQKSAEERARYEQYMKTK